MAKWISTIVAAMLCIGLFKADNLLAANNVELSSWGQVKNMPTDEIQPAAKRPVWKDVLAAEIEGIGRPGGLNSSITELGIYHLAGDQLYVVVGFPASLLGGVQPTSFQMEFMGHEGDVISAVSENAGYDGVEYSVQFQMFWTGSPAQIDLISNGTTDRYFGRLTISARSSLTVSVIPVAGTRERQDKGHVSVLKNTAMADNTSFVPSGVVGSAYIRIGSGALSTDSIERFYFPSLTLASNLPAGVLGRVFRDMKVVDAISNAQVGSTEMHLGDETTFRFGHTVVSGLYFNVYASVSYDALPEDLAALNSATNGTLRVRPVPAVSMETDRTLSSQGDVDLQKVYIAEHGSLTVTLEADTPSEQQVVMGSTGVEVVKVRLQAGTEEDVQVSEQFLSGLMLISEATPLGGTFYNFRLYQGTTQVGPTSNFGHQSVAPFMGTDLVIPRGTSISVRGVADVSTSANATSGATGVFGFLPDYDPETPGDQPSIVARGLTSGASIPVRFGRSGDEPVLGNKITVYATKLAIQAASDNPHGRVYTEGADDQVIAKVVVSNPANADNYSSLMTGLVFDVTTGGMSIAAGQSSIQLRLYKDIVASANLIGEMAWVEGDFSRFENLAVETASGASHTFILTMDTNYLVMDPSGAALSVSMLENGIAWQDNVGEFMISGADSLPVDFGIIIYR